MMPHILLYKEIHKCVTSLAGERLGVDDQIDALDNQLVIFLLRTLTWRCRIAQKSCLGTASTSCEDVCLEERAFLVEHVQVRATDELDHGTFREYRGTTVQTGIGLTDFGNIHVAGGILSPSLAHRRVS